MQLISFIKYNFIFYLLIEDLQQRKIQHKLEKRLTEYNSWLLELLSSTSLKMEVENVIFVCVLNFFVIVIQKPTTHHFSF
jgi:hypothetical protein